MIIWWVEELSYPFEDLRGTHAATCDRVVLVHVSIGVSKNLSKGLGGGGRGGWGMCYHSPLKLSS